MPLKIAEGDLLYHAVHGLCRVSDVRKQKESGKEVLSYALVPKVSNQMKLRYVISANELEASGFHVLISVKEANEILEYLKRSHIAAPQAEYDPKAPRSFAENNQTWALARSILACALDANEAKEQRKRQTLERSARGLAHELAFVLGITVRETVLKLRRSLESTSKLNPLVLTALENASQD